MQPMAIHDRRLGVPHVRIRLLMRGMRGRENKQKMARGRLPGDLPWRAVTGCDRAGLGRILTDGKGSGLQPPRQPADVQIANCEQRPNRSSSPRRTRSRHAGRIPHAIGERIRPPRRKLARDAGPRRANTEQRGRGGDPLQRDGQPLKTPPSCRLSAVQELQGSFPFLGRHLGFPSARGRKPSCA